MNTQQKSLALIDATLNFDGHAASPSADTPLLGAISELDSMAVVALTTGLEESISITTDDDGADDSISWTIESFINSVPVKLAC